MASTASAIKITSVLAAEPLISTKCCTNCVCNTIVNYSNATKIISVLYPSGTAHFYTADGQKIISHECGCTSNVASIDPNGVYIAYGVADDSQLLVTFADSQLDTVSIGGHSQHWKATIRYKNGSTLIGLEWIDGNRLAVISSAGISMFRISAHAEPVHDSSIALKVNRYLYHAPSRRILVFSDRFSQSVATILVDNITGKLTKAKKLSFSLPEPTNEGSTTLDGSDSPELRLLVLGHDKVYIYVIEEAAQTVPRPVLLRHRVPGATHIMYVEQCIAVISEPHESVVLFDPRVTAALHGLDPRDEKLDVVEDTPMSLRSCLPVIPAMTAGPMTTAICPSTRPPTPGRRLLGPDLFHDAAAGTVCLVRLSLPAVLRHHIFSQLHVRVMFVLMRGPQRHGDIVDILSEAVDSHAPLHSVIAAIRSLMPLRHTELKSPPPPSRPAAALASPLAKLVSPQTTLGRAMKAVVTSPSYAQPPVPARPRLSDAGQVIISKLVGRLSRNTTQDPAYLLSVVVVIISSMVRHGLPVRHEVMRQLTELLVRSGRFYQLHQFVQHGLIPSSETSAITIGSTADRWDMALVVARDMLGRGKLYEALVSFTAMGCQDVPKADRASRLYGVKELSKAGVEADLTDQKYQHWVL
ncbi:Colon cancer-associated protein Mic1-like [Carpediemonas membranifera]|uniref:Colon cancer-associated protein Mic1-like n=1 Tax=Carpediemonas membranifera TaxID=201153 RepID=A0A8J6EAZ6_9EUKA|nr:Colon cancer-associated protein Mic1-like [Carpediemonas membranifera]|eukprot:KAG9395800.1 Colon cancer-associated protein Mic1-like [Carpediemonas membranifera]